jgi:coiled-coil and C2 domain-containing protein 2A
MIWVVSGVCVQVGMIYDHSNIWANIQQEAQPWNMAWNLLIPIHWKPFFGTQVGLLLRV